MPPPIFTFCVTDAVSGGATAFWARRPSCASSEKGVRVTAARASKVDLMSMFGVGINDDMERMYASFFQT
ncbi:hypothetical protein [Verrucomicrobium spinosum]|uniref:hypothetical protein n=1 Tax=Verrucomicrobium spinosum TaxID=2736 RepID=UPI00155DBA26|nr:hypothetical protein [Verrucomicrobium spinosum]